MILPLIQAGVEKRYKLLRTRVESSEVRSLAQVATMASKCQVVEFFGAAVLFGNYVFDMVSKMTVLLAEQAVLATIPGPLTDQISQFGIGHG
jgi:hypothetical protein